MKIISHLVETEMERDAGISHGASSFLRERLMYASDGYQAVFCKICGNFAVNDAATRMYKKCRICDNEREFGRAVIPYVYKLLIHLLGAMGIFMRPDFLDSAEYAEMIFAITLRGQIGDIANIQAELGEADEGLEEEIFDETLEQEGEETNYGDIYDE